QRPSTKFAAAHANDSRTPSRLPPAVPMFSDLISKARRATPISSPRSKGRRIALAVVAAVCLVVGFGFHVIEWQSGSPFSTATEVLYQINVLGGYDALWYLLSEFFRQRQASPLKILRTTLVVCLFLMRAVRLIICIAMPSDIE